MQRNDFHLLINFCAREKLLLCCFVFACFCFVNWFWFDLGFLRRKSFRKKKDRLKVILITSFTILLRFTLMKIHNGGKFIQYRICGC